MQLAIPTNAQRVANFDAYMPASTNHPNALEVFRHAAVAGKPQYADLGMWNIYLNVDVPNPQANLKSFVCAAGKDCSVDQGLASTIAQFKTPVLRDLQDSAPYFHNGSAATFNDVIAPLHCDDRAGAVRGHAQRSSRVCQHVPKPG